MDVNRIIRSIIGAAIEVHEEIGPGYPEQVYQRFLTFELRERGHRVETEVEFDVVYKSCRFERGLRCDVIVDGRVLIELKAVHKVKMLHLRQASSYMAATGMEVGLLINFNEVLVKNGLRRIFAPRERANGLIYGERFDENR